MFFHHGDTDPPFDLVALLHTRQMENIKTVYHSHQDAFYSRHLVLTAQSTVETSLTHIFSTAYRALSSVMSLVPTTTSAETMISPNVPEKLLDRNSQLYHLLHPESPGIQNGYIEEAPEDANATIRTTSGSACAHSGPCSAGGRKKNKKKLWRISIEGDEEAAMKQIGRGMLTVITTPIALVGIAIYGTGLVIEGTGNILKGFGSLGRHAFVSPRLKRHRSSDSLHETHH